MERISTSKLYEDFTGKDWLHEMNEADKRLDKIQFFKGNQVSQSLTLPTGTNLQIRQSMAMDSCYYPYDRFIIFKGEKIVVDSNDNKLLLKEELVDKETINFDNAIKWATREGFDFYEKKWRREDDGKVISNKQLFEQFSKTIKHLK